MIRKRPVALRRAVAEVVLHACLLGRKREPEDTLWKSAFLKEAGVRKGIHLFFFFFFTLITLTWASVLLSNSQIRNVMCQEVTRIELKIIYFGGFFEFKISLVLKRQLCTLPKVLIYH